MELKDNLKALRAEKGITVTQLAAQLNKGESAVRMWEIGRSNPDLDTLVKLSEIFECSTDYLLGLDDSRNKLQFVELNQALIDFGELLNETGKANEIINSLIKILLVPHYFEEDDTSENKIEENVFIKCFSMLLKYLGDASSRACYNYKSILKANSISASKFSDMSRFLDIDADVALAATSVLFTSLMEKVYREAIDKAKDDDAIIIKNIWLSFHDKMPINKAKSDLLSAYEDINKMAIEGGDNNATES